MPKVDLTVSINPKTYVFDFGKHRGETYKDVLRIFPRYIAWCMDNVAWFVLSKRERNRVYAACAKAYKAKFRRYSRYRYLGHHDTQAYDIYGSESDLLL